MKEKIYFGAGCFWSVQEFFNNVSGVLETKVGYMGGYTVNPSYEEVLKGDTGHIEVVEVIYNTEVIQTEELLKLFWEIHDPKQKDGQGVDKGEQYMSHIFYTNSTQKELALKTKSSLVDSESVVTKVLEVKEFYPAEEYHQEYIKKNKHQYN